MWRKVRLNMVTNRESFSVDLPEIILSTNFSENIILGTLPGPVSFGN